MTLNINRKSDVKEKPMAGATVIEARDLCKSYSNESVQQHVIKNLNLKIRQGDFTVIMGNSGSGKSTLLYSLSGMDKPTLGQVLFEDQDISRMSNDKLAIFRRDNCGFVFQQNYLNDTMSALDNVMVCGLLKNKNKKALAEKAKGLLTKVGIGENDWRKFPSQLSGGQQQRVAVVRSVINEPTILFADEPTGALNSQNSANVLDILTDLNEAGQSIVMVTHSSRAASRGNRVLYLADGIVTSEIDIGKYDPKAVDTEEGKARYARLKAFLQEMGW